MKAIEIIITFLIEMLVEIVGGILGGAGSVVQDILGQKDHGYQDRFSPVRDIAKARNKGVAVGATKRLSLKTSFAGVLISGKPGTGKSTCVTIPTLVSSHASFVVHDPSGEVRHACLPYLRRNGYEDVILDYSNPEISDGYNLVSRLHTQTDFSKASEILMRPLESGGGDKFWSLESRNLTQLGLAILHHVPKRYQNPYNLLHLIANFQSSAEHLDRFIVKVADEELWSMYKSMVGTDTKTLSNVVATCRSALGIFNSSEIAKITAHDTLGDLKTRLRKKKTVVFINSKTMDAKRLSPISNLFFTQLFSDLLSELPAQGDHPVLLLIDEFGSLYLPDAEVFAANCRKYHVAFTAMVQNTDQLVRNYSLPGAKALMSTLTTHIVFPGTNIDEAKQYSDRLGKYSYEAGERNIQRTRELLTPTEVMFLKEREVLVFSGNKPGARVNVTPFYRSRSMRAATSLPPVVLPERIPNAPVPLLDLKQL